MLKDKNGNEKSYKTRLEQFNYSCIPNEDGTLKGAVQPANSVGMDVDFNEAEIGKIPEVVERILAKKDEIGLLMLEKSATKGLHLVFKRKPELSQEGNLKSVSETLNVPFDEGAKDITRVFFTPTSQDIIFIDERLFDFGECGKVEEKGKRQSKTKKEEERNISIPKEEKPLKENLIAFDLCADSAGLDVKKMDVWGENNWHNNLMAVLSAGFPKLMSREQAFAVVTEKLPDYAQDDDCKALVNHFYDNYNSTMFLSPAMREINAKAQRLARNEQEREDDEMAVLMQGWDAPVLPERIPRLMDLLVSNYDKRFREMLLLSALPVLSAHASHFRARYLNGQIIGPQTYVSVIGGSGSGKGCCTALYKDMIENTLAAHDAEEWEKVKKNQEERDMKANAKDRPQKYHPKLRLFETTSKSSILELQTNLGKNGMLLGQFSEVDGLSKATRTAYSDISVLLRKGWDMDMHRQYYMSESTCNTFVQMSISLLMAGTVRAMLERMFTDENREGGLMQRCIPVLVPLQKRTFRPPRQNFLKVEEMAERDRMLMSLYQKDVELGDDVKVLGLPKTTKAIGQWFDELEYRYNEGMLTEAEADLSHRCGEFIMRAAIPLVALEGRETREIVDFCVWVGRYAHYTMCRLYGKSTQMNIDEAVQMLNGCQDKRKTNEPLMNLLNDTFTLKQIKDLRERNGLHANVRPLLTSYIKKGKIMRLARGIYRKIPQK